MNISRNLPAFIALFLSVAGGAAAGARAASEPNVIATRSGAHDFDFEIGHWRVHHRVKRVSDGEWTQFDGTSSTRMLMRGSANVEDNEFRKPGATTQGVALRAYDAKSKTWAIWWIDGRAPHGLLDPPVKGRFESGIGRFYSDAVVDGRPMRTRFTWSAITPRSARWEQAYSFDDGTTWDTNWTMDFRRVAGKRIR